MIIYSVQLRLRPYSINVSICVSLRIKRPKVLQWNPISSYGVSPVTCHGITHPYLPPDTSEHSQHTPRLNPSQLGWYSIYLPLRDGKLSWRRPKWPVTYRDSLPAHRWSPSPIQILTQHCTARSRTRNLLITSPTPYRPALHQQATLPGNSIVNKTVNKSEL